MSELIRISNFTGPRAPWELFRKEVLPVEPARVWRALVDPDELARWWCNQAEVDLREGGRYAFRGPLVYGGAGAPAQPDDLEILELAPDERLRFRWRLHGAATEVTYELSNVLELTELFVTQTAEEPPAFGPGAEEPNWWWVALPALRTYLETGKAALRLDYAALEAAPRLEFQVEVFTFPWIIWHKLTDPKELARWWAKKAEVELVPGGPFRLGLPGAGPSRLLEFNPGQRLVHDWIWEGGTTGRVEWTIRETDEATLVAVIDHGPWDAGDRRALLALHWASLLLHLKQMSERGVTPRDYQAPGVVG